MIKKILKLIRTPNLVFIVIIQYSMRFFVLKPILSEYNLELLFSGFNFFLLVTATVLLAASGYIINDYFDTEHDKKAGKTNVFNNGINKNTAFYVYLALNIIAIAIGFYISSLIGLYKLGIVFILISGLLWFYSSSFKTSFLLGNIIIALLAALVPLIVLPYEILLQFELNRNALISAGNNLSDISFWILGYSSFAFIMTLIREIIKDTEDYKADIEFNYTTLPIKIGKKATKYVVAGLVLTTIALLFFIILKYLNLHILQIIYIITFVIMPLTNIGIFIFKANEQKHYRGLSLLTKITMFTGVLFTITNLF
ncbi:MAG: geranylgeranylglycerol-phosphate geranylgeranyltransferase [Bacteroidota bacterium]|nr:geranylgeranylglycerol-phosphate geranylgeranyltransferase [Bacteroidota bacterium]